MEDYYNNEEELIPAGGGEITEYEGNPFPVDPNDFVGNIKDISTKVCDTIISWKEMDVQMHQLDVQFDTFIAKIDYELSMYRERIPVVEKQLNFVNDQMSKILDHVLTMDAETESEINMKMRLLDTSERYLDKLSGMMMKLL